MTLRAAQQRRVTWMRSCVHFLVPEPPHTVRHSPDIRASYLALRLVQESNENTAVPWDAQSTNTFLEPG